MRTPGKAGPIRQRQRVAAVVTWVERPEGEPLHSRTAQTVRATARQVRVVARGGAAPAGQPAGAPGVAAARLALAAGAAARLGRRRGAAARLSGSPYCLAFVTGDLSPRSPSSAFSVVSFYLPDFVKEYVNVIDPVGRRLTSGYETIEPFSNLLSELLVYLLGS